MAKRRPSIAAPPATSRADLALARRAYAKLWAAEKPTDREQAALQRVETAERERLLRSLPKGVYASLADRQVRTINAQARTYGLPLLGRTIDLYAVLSAFHDLLAEHGRKILATSNSIRMNANASRA